MSATEQVLIEKIRQLPPQRLAVGDLLVQRNFTIVRREISALLPDPSAGD